MDEYKYVPERNTEDQIKVDKIETIDEMGKSYKILVRIPEQRDNLLNLFMEGRLTLILLK
jgi:hypothetical protein